MGYFATLGFGGIRGLECGKGGGGGRIDDRGGGGEMSEAEAAADDGFGGMESGLDNDSIGLGVYKFFIGIDEESGGFE